jgi:flagellar basal body P-ring formation protein FlgA
MHIAINSGMESTLRKFRRYASLGALILAVAVPSSVWSQSYQDIESLRETARQAIALESGNQDEFELGLDPGLKLPQCPLALAGERYSRSVIEVSCPGGWRIYVPLRTRTSGNVVVIARPIARGTRLDDELLRVEQRELSRLPAETFVDLKKLHGMQATRSLASGTPLTSRDVEPATRIKRGDIVTLTARGGGIEVRVPGVAMADAGIDEWLTVRNIASNRVMQGVVVESGEVECRW